MKLVKLGNSKIKDLTGRTMWMLLNPADHHVSSMSVCVIKVPEGESVRPAHSHEKSEEFIYIIAGEGHITVDNKDYELKAGSGILVEASEVHSLHNTGKDVMEAICMFVPPSTPEDYTCFEK